MQGLDLGVHTGQPLVEDQGVGKNGAGHAAGLGHIGHAQQPGDMGGNGRALLGHVVQDAHAGVNAVLEGAGRGVYGVLGDGHEADQIGQIGN